MSIKSIVAGALALLVPAVPSAALAQTTYYPEQPRYYAPPESSTTALTVVPPAYGSVYVYEGRALLGRFDGPGVLWLPTGDVSGPDGYAQGHAADGLYCGGAGQRSSTGAPVARRSPLQTTWSPRMATMR